MEIYNYDAIGEYYASSLADEDPLEKGKFLIPAYATTIKPPPEIEHQVPLFIDGEWVLKNDYRNERACELDIDGTFISFYYFEIDELPDELHVLIDLPPKNMHKPMLKNGIWVDAYVPPILTIEDTITVQDLMSVIIDLTQQLNDKGVL